MPQLLTLSRAARLVNVSRGALQKRIKNGDLPTFEGMVKATDLVKLYPQTKFVDDTALERANQIRDAAYAKRIRERILPDAETLAARLSLLAKELADTKTHAARYRTALEVLQHALAGDAPKDAANLTNDIKNALDQALGPLTMDEPFRELTVKDSILRVMAAHVHLLPSQHEFFVEGNDSILDAALRSGLSVDYGCSSGNCGLCKAKVLAGQTKKIRPHDYILSDAEKNQGYVLLCSHTALTDLTIEAHEATNAREIPRQQISTRVKAAEPLNRDVRLLHVQTPRTNRLRFLAGQSIRVTAGGVTATLPIASCPCDDRNIQFHVPSSTHAPFAQAVAALKPQDTVALDGPEGEFVLNEESPRTPVFIACDTGFAPIKSLIEHAMALDTAEAIYLYWIAHTDDGHYQSNLCRAWSDALDNFHYTPIRAVAEGDTSALEQILERHPDLTEVDVYLSCPSPLINQAVPILKNHRLPPDRLRWHPSL